MKKILLLILSSLILFSCKPVSRYVGEVTDVDYWSGNATLKTKTKNGKDTVVKVVPRKHEEFVVGQTITCWCDGENFDGDCSTKPQK